MTTDVVSQTIVSLFETERFYAEIILQMRRIYSTKVPVAGVCIKDGIELHINLKSFAEMALPQRVAVLRHECEHILRNHIPRMKELAPDVYADSKDMADRIIANSKHHLLNIAADCAINCNIPNLPEGGMFPSKFNLPNYETFEWYAEQLKDNEELKNINEIEDHYLWAESEGDKEVLKEIVRQSIKDAASRTRAAGRMTSENELLISELTAVKVNWRDQLKRFVARNNISTRESSKKKRNRRYGIAFPGDIKVEQLTIGVAIDTSGSVSDEALEQFMTEIHNIAKYATVTVVEADSEIKNTYTYDPRKKYTIKGRGGTAYQPAFDYFNKNNKIDALVYFGDMDNYDTEVLIKPKYPVLWAIVGNQDRPANFGTEIRVKVD